MMSRKAMEFFNGRTAGDTEETGGTENSMGKVDIETKMELRKMVFMSMGRESDGKKRRRMNGR
jgi:hypothetical protein